MTVIDTPGAAATIPAMAQDDDTAMPDEALDDVHGGFTATGHGAMPVGGTDRPVGIIAILIG